MERVVVRPARPDPAAIAKAADVLRSGGVVAFPTETVYGLAADAGQEAARRKLYRMKGRDPEKACAYLLPDRDAALSHVGELPRFARRLADVFWPGPLTLVVPGPDGVLVGLRLPSEGIARNLAAAAGRPLLQTSANRSGEPAPVDASVVGEIFGADLDFLLDGGGAPGGRPSTVVQCDDESWSILREGAIPAGGIVRAATELTLVACTGNLCRSPLAEALLRKEVAALLGCEVEDVVRRGHRFASFGTAAVEGHPASEHSVTVARELGCELDGHRSRAFSLDLVRDATRVYYLARNHLDLLAPYFRDRPGVLQPLRPDGKDVPDPIGRSLGVYRRAARAIHDACRARAREIVGAGG